MVRNVGPVGPSGDPAAPQPSDGERTLRTEAGRILEKTLDHHPEYCAANGDQGCDCPLLPGILAIEAESERVSPHTLADCRRAVEDHIGQERVSLDVERLARAIDVVDLRAPYSAWAALIADEYARLSPSTGTPEAKP